MMTLFTIFIALIFLYIIGSLFSPKPRHVQYKNSNYARIRNSSGVKIIQSSGDSDIDLEVHGNRSITFNGHDIDIPRRIRHGYDNAIVEMRNDSLYVNGHKYDKYTGLFSNEQEYEM